MNLKKIISSVQNISEAISSVIKVDVTVVDKDLDRIAGTGRYRKDIGNSVSENSVFGFALRNGESFIIENPGKHSACLKCESVNNCKEYAEVCCPIKIDNSIVGVIGLIAFEEKQKIEIISNQDNLMKFLNRMADLISSKLMEQDNTEKIELLAKELEIVLDSVDRGIIATNHEGEILRFNRKAIQLFQIDEEEVFKMNISELIGDVNFSYVLEGNKDIKNKEFVYKTKKHHFRGIFDVDPISIGNKNLGIVFTFSNISDVINTVNNITTGTIVTSFDNIVGKSDCLKSVKLEAEKAANSCCNVLIQGESGTGKELFARAIHFHGKRANGPFIPINCAAIPEQLLESELFGYESGAFTGARRGGKAGKFELANKGTIFLDEIGDMPIHLQPKLLRVLQERVIEKIGGKDYIPIDVRVIAATNKDLEKKVLDGEFRQDLFYRLNVIPLYIPSLRERKDDIGILVQYMIEKCNRKLEKNIKDIDSKVLDIFKNYNWPGNVRELENAIEYAVSMCNRENIQEIHLINRLKNISKAQNMKTTEEIIPIKELEKCEIKKALEFFSNTDKPMINTAKALGISRATLYRKIKEYEIN